MNVATPAPAVSAFASTSLLPGTGCPLNHGTAVVDQLLAAITRDRADESFELALDAALDFRLLLAGETDPDTLLHSFFRLRHIVEERHYLACFRLRRWLEAQFCARVFFSRCEPSRTLPLKLDATTLPELRTRCTQRAAGIPAPAWTRVQFIRADLVVAASV